MRVQQWLVTATLVLGAPALAMAQAGTTPDPAAQEPQVVDPQQPTPPPSPTTAPGRDLFMDPMRNQWYATGFVGSHFGASAQEAGGDFGGAIGHLWNNSLGLEFMAGFTPNFNLAEDILLGDEPSVNSYMFNAVAAAPLGFEGQWQPFISGGLGAMTLRSDVIEPGDAFDNVFNPDDTRLGANIGVGVMGFAGNWGVRGDVRYFRAFAGDDFAIDDDTGVAGTVLSGLDFWRANIGLAFRW